VLGAVFALAASAGLAWWLVSSQAPAPAPTVAVRPLARLVAPAKADFTQVQRAFDAVQDAYADGGADGLAQADDDCAAALKTDARVLDYCLAFDLFASAVAPQVARGDPEGVRLAQARAALPPGADPAARVSQVRALMRQASLGGAAAAPRIASEEPAAPVIRPVPATRRAHVATREAQQRREEARAAVRALFARAEAAHEAAGDANAFSALPARSTEDETAPH
jgi:hypothetical protein